jgi:hypothetical protein
MMTVDENQDFIVVDMDANDTKKYLFIIKMHAFSLNATFQVPEHREWDTATYALHSVCFYGFFLS